MTLSKKWLKITFLILGSIILLTTLAIFLLPNYAKHKLVSTVNTQTDFRLKIDNIKLKGLTTLVINGIELKPKLDKTTFNKTNGVQKDWIKFNAQTLTVEGINWLEIYQTEHLFLEKIILENPHIYAYRDRKFPEAAYEYKPLPSEQLKNCKTLFTIPLIELKQGKITYEEMPENGEKSGVISFSELYASIYHLSTQEEYQNIQPTVIVEGKGKILDSISAEMTYKFHPKNNKSTFEGKVKSFSATVLNQCIQPLANTKIASGHINWLNLKFEADNKQAIGIINIDYKDLQIKVLSEDTDHHTSKVKTFVANLLLYDDNKPDATKVKTLGEIKFERRQDRYIFNYWWNAIKSGITSSITKVNIPQKKK